MSAKTSNRLSIGAVLLAVIVPIGQKALDTGQKVLESKLVKMETAVKAEAKDSDDLTIAMMDNMLGQIEDMRREIRELRERR